MSLNIGGSAIALVSFCGRARLEAKFANNRGLRGPFVLNRGTRKAGWGARFGLVQALEQTESAKDVPQIACNSGTTKQPRQPAPAPAECRQRSNPGRATSQQQTEVGQTEMEIERQHGWSPEMEVCRRRAGKAAIGRNAIRSRISVELALLWASSEKGSGFRMSNVAVVWPLWPPRGSEVRHDLRRRAKTPPLHH